MLCQSLLVSQSLAYEEMSKLNHIRKERETAHAYVHHAFQEVQMIEADNLAGQDDHSEFAEATRAVDNSNQEVHRVFHKLAQTPEEESISTNETRLVEMSRLPESNKNQETHQLRNVVENAKLMVAQREMRLRQLGAKILKSGYGKR